MESSYKVSALSTIVGIDPGLSGAIAILSDYGDIIIRDNPVKVVKHLPIKKRGKRTKYPREILVDIKGTLALAKQLIPLDAIVFIENPSGGKVTNRRGIHKLIESTTAWRCAVEAVVTADPVLLTPLKWKNHIPQKYKDTYKHLEGRDRLAQMKQASIELAIELYPEAEDAIEEKDGRAEALLISHYGIKYHAEN